MARSSDSESEIVFLNELNSNGSSSEENKIDIELSSITHAVDGISISGKDNSRVDMEGGVVVTGGQNYTRSDSINLGLFDDSSDECDGIDLADEQSEKVETDVLTPGSKLGDVQSTMHTKLKAKLEVRSNSEAEMENILERFSEESCGNKLKETLEEIGGEKYQLVVEKSANTDEEEEDFCCICRDEHNNPKVLPKCSHKFCTECIDQYFRIKPVCPVCFVAYGVITGNQPKGHMSDRVLPKLHLPGYEKYDTITIHYSFGDGTQTVKYVHCIRYLIFIHIHTMNINIGIGKEIWGLII